MVRTSPPVIDLGRNARFAVRPVLRSTWGVAGSRFVERLLRQRRQTPALQRPLDLLLRRTGVTRVMVQRMARNLISVNASTHVAGAVATTVVSPGLKTVLLRQTHSTNRLELLLRSVERHFRTIERVRQVVPPRAQASQPQTVGVAPAASVRTGSDPVVPPERPPVPTVLRRSEAHATSAERAAATVTPVDARTPDRRATLAEIRSNAPDQGLAALTPGQLNRLTENVIRSIDSRLISQRERMGRR